MRGRKTLGAALLTALLILGTGACGDDDPAGVDEELRPVAEVFGTGLHATAEGMRHWYNQPDGFGSLIGVAYDGLSCGGCHAGSTCTDCHADPNPAPGSVREQALCLGCHGRQMAEVQMNLPDVHRSAGMLCTDCHTAAEIHGDGTPYNSMFEEGATETRCQTCHQEVEETIAHSVHGDKLACQTCHMATSVTCVNCHFETEILEDRKQAYGKFTGWQFLGNYRGQVYPLNFQSVEYGEHTFAAWGPFSGHTITREGRDCTECHGSDKVREYLATGSIQVVTWDEVQRKLVGAKGMIPVPPDYATALKMDFATFRDGGWHFLEHGTDRMQMMYATPLTQLQINRMGN